MQAMKLQIGENRLQPEMKYCSRTDYQWTSVLQIGTLTVTRIECGDRVRQFEVLQNYIKNIRHPKHFKLTQHMCGKL